MARYKVTQIFKYETVVEAIDKDSAKEKGESIIWENRSLFAPSSLNPPYVENVCVKTSVKRVKEVKK